VLDSPGCPIVTLRYPSGAAIVYRDNNSEQEVLIDQQLRVLVSSPSSGESVKNVTPSVAARANGFRACDRLIPPLRNRNAY
jgi:hypothetical protein